MRPVCVLACGLRQASNATKTAERAADEAPERGNPALRAHLSSPEEVWDCGKCCCGPPQVTARWWAGPMRRKGRGRGSCLCTGGIATRAEPPWSEETGC